MRPLAAGDVLDGTVTILRRGFRTLAAIVLFVHAPYQLLSALVLDRFLPELDDPFLLDPFLDGTVPVELLTRMLLVGGITAIVALLVHVLVGGAVASAIVDLDHGRQPRAGAALRASSAVSGSTLGASVLLLAAGIGFGAVLAVGIGVLALAATPLAVVAGVVALPVVLGAGLALSYLVLPIAVVEHTGPLRTLGRAVWVLRRRFWWVIGVTLLALLLVAAVSFALGLGLGVAALFAGPAAFVVEAAIGTLSALVSVPLTIGAAALIHHDARVRGEGHDLRARAQPGPWA
ncbi:MAG TPA: hypothetical protein VK906_15210 [Egicoccus sp.]|nr:hypothetical protein [Egicoccus sp.]HSK24533.1 hypothetical protein [Egicoccus sp.]